MATPPYFNPRARVGRDQPRRALPLLPCISIHAPVWGATHKRRNQPRVLLFQSTRPAWGATRCRDRRRHVREISIHAPRVGRDINTRIYFFASMDFNPRAPRGARRGLRLAIPILAKFQSTRPAWGATVSTRFKVRSERISIHAPRVGRDSDELDVICYSEYFNPRAPRGARRMDAPAERRRNGFQSTRPAWGATDDLRRAMGFLWISIHAPRVGRDVHISAMSLGTLDFNPRAPRGARRSTTFSSTRLERISIHAPRVGRDADVLWFLQDAEDFNPRAPRGARLCLFTRA